MAEGGNRKEVVLMTSSLAKLLRKSISNPQHNLIFQKASLYSDKPLSFLIFDPMVNGVFHKGLYDQFDRFHLQNSCRCRI